MGVKKNKWSLKLIEEKRKAILESLARGATVKAAVEAAGVSRDTHYTWVKRDEDYARAVYEAQARAIRTAEDVVFSAIERGDVKVAMWFLERRVPEYRYTAYYLREEEDYEVELDEADTQGKG